LIVGAVGALQFDVVAFRLKHEYGVDCQFEPVGVATARWVYADDAKQIERLKDRQQEHLATDVSGALAYIAPTRVNLQLTEERWPELTFSATREH
jgi:peptide chain release factor 3